MSRTRRNLSAKFKSELVIELLKGEKDLNTIATENNIQPNLLRNWKKEFLDKASVVFDDTREDNLKEKLALERKEKAEYAKKVGLLTKRWFIILRQKKRIKKYQKGRVKKREFFHASFSTNINGDCKVHLFCFIIVFQLHVQKCYSFHILYRQQE